MLLTVGQEINSRRAINLIVAMVGDEIDFSPAESKPFSFVLMKETLAKDYILKFPDNDVKWKTKF